MDCKIYDQGDGGEINILDTGDIETDNTLSNLVYMSLFQGNNWYSAFEEETTDEVEKLMNEFISSKDSIEKLKNTILSVLEWLINDRIVDDIKVNVYPLMLGNIVIDITTVYNNHNNLYTIKKTENKINFEKIV
jgi:phage gp46-like protein